MDLKSMLQDKVWVWSLGSGVWSLKSGIWSLGSGFWRGRGRLELGAVGEGGAEGDLIGKGEIDAKRKPAG